MKFDTYTDLFKLEIPEIKMKKISDLIIEQRPEYEISKHIKLLTEFYIICCDCSDRDISDDHASFGYFDEYFPSIIFVDPEAPSSVGEIVGHELIHAIQKLLFKDFSLNSEWQEEIAYGLEGKVSEIIKDEMSALVYLASDHFYIEEFKFSMLDKNIEEKIISDEKLEEKFKVQKSTEQYFFDKEDIHNNYY